MHAAEDMVQQALHTVHRTYDWTVPNCIYTACHIAVYIACNNAAHCSQELESNLVMQRPATAGYTANSTAYNVQQTGESVGQAVVLNIADCRDFAVLSSHVHMWTSVTVYNVRYAWTSRTLWKVV